MPFQESMLRQQATPIVEGLGFRVVEFSVAKVSGRAQVALVIYRESGIGIDDCAQVHRTLLPRLELLMNDRDVALQVMSPGIDRVFKSWTEFGVFVGRGASVLLRDNEAWISGVISRATESEVELTRADGARVIRFSDIQKARLDYSQEVR